MNEQRDEHTHPHPLANEMVDDQPERPAAATPHPKGGAPRREGVVPSEEKRLGALALKFIVGAVIAAGLLAAMFFGDSVIVIVAVVVFAAYMLLILAPVILARGTKISQDESTGEGR